MFFFKKHIDSKDSDIVPPFAPAFVIRAPPIVPGIPLENSNPTRPFLKFY